MFADLSSACLPAHLPLARRPAYWHSNLHIWLSNCLPACLTTCSLELRPGYLIQTCISAWKAACQPTFSLTLRSAYWHSNLNICLSSCLPACLSSLLFACLWQLLSSPSARLSILPVLQLISWRIFACSTLLYIYLHEWNYLSICVLWLLSTFRTNRSRTAEMYLRYNSL